MYFATFEPCIAWNLSRLPKGSLLDVTVIASPWCPSKTCSWKLMWHDGRAISQHSTAKKQIDREGDRPKSNPVILLTSASRVKGYGGLTVAQCGPSVIQCLLSLLRPVRTVVVPTSALELSSCHVHTTNGVSLMNFTKLGSQGEKEEVTMSSVVLRSLALGKTCLMSSLVTGMWTQTGERSRAAGKQAIPAKLLMVLASACDRLVRLVLYRRQMPTVSGVIDFCGVAYSLASRSRGRHGRSQTTGLRFCRRYTARR